MQVINNSKGRGMLCTILLLAGFYRLVTQLKFLRAAKNRPICSYNPYLFCIFHK